MVSAHRAVPQAGAYDEADGFRRFIQRSAAGSARDLQIMYGLGGERRWSVPNGPAEPYVRLGLASDANGTIYACDSSAAYAFAPDGTLRWKVPAYQCEGVIVASGVVYLSASTLLALGD